MQYVSQNYDNPTQTLSNSPSQSPSKPMEIKHGSGTIYEENNRPYAKVEF